MKRKKKIKINLNKTELLKVRGQFHKYYQLLNGSKLNDSITINWSTFKKTIETDSGIDNKEEILLRFIHRLKDSRWYLTMECCHVNEYGKIDHVGNSFDLTDYSIIKSDFRKRFDLAYQKSVTYNGTPLARLLSARSVTFPWKQEFVKAALVNKIFSDNSVNIKFVSVTYNNSNGYNMVEYPHLLAMFFSSENIGDMVNDGIVQTNSIVKPFKAFNCGSVCPPSCDDFAYFELFFDLKCDELSIPTAELVL